MQITFGSLLSILHLLIVYYSRWADFFLPLQMQRIKIKSETKRCNVRIILVPAKAVY